MGGESSPAVCGEPIEAPFALAGLLHPPSLDQAAVLEPQQGGVERRQRKTQAPAGPRFDELPDLVSMPRPGLQQRQDQHLGAALLQFRTEHSASLYVTTRSIDDGKGRKVVACLNPSAETTVLPAPTATDTPGRFCSDVPLARPSPRQAGARSPHASPDGDWSRGCGPRALARSPMAAFRRGRRGF